MITYSFGSSYSSVCNYSKLCPLFINYYMQFALQAKGPSRRGGETKLELRMVPFPRVALALALLLCGVCAGKWMRAECACICVSRRSHMTMAAHAQS